MILHKTSARNIAIAKAAHLDVLPELLQGEKSILLPVTAFIVRILYIYKKPLNENLILKNIRSANVHMVNHTVHVHMCSMASSGIAQIAPGGGLWVLTPAMLEMIEEYKPVEPEGMVA